MHNTTFVNVSKKHPNKNKLEILKTLIERLKVI
ncbi:hypothetical protein CSHISOI_11351 [Colletotrichum shisoi]|uniref:Uncharacterized protein n=1 Tax=Colletotrichum shisoi TaxID=2078593 RepID=A0A5Q4BB06_9PEZI|nr:hypothetical protein CSHISOI_11351 [Colletotrichum shisoi]